MKAMIIHDDMKTVIRIQSLNIHRLAPSLQEIHHRERDRETIRRVGTHEVVKRRVVQHLDRGARNALRHRQNDDLRKHLSHTLQGKLHPLAVFHALHDRRHVPVVDHVQNAM